MNRLGNISSSFFTSHMRLRDKTAPADMLDASFWTGLAGKLTFLQLLRNYRRQNESAGALKMMEWTPQRSNFDLQPANLGQFGKINHFPFKGETSPLGRRRYERTFTLKFSGNMWTQQRCCSCCKRYQTLNLYEIRNTRTHFI